MDTQPKPKRKFHWWRVVLVLSLALNLLIFGLVAGAAFRFKDGPPPRDLAARDVGYGAFIAAFDHDERRALGKAYRAQMPDRKQMRETLARDRAALLGALRAEPFDPAAFEAVLTKRQSDLMATQGKGQKLLMDQIRSMDTSARQAYADRLEEVLKRGPRKSKDGRDKGGK